MYGESVMSISVSPARHFFVVNPVCFDNRQKMESMIAEIHHFFNELNNSSHSRSSEYAVHISRFPRDAISAIQRFANAVPGTVPLRVYAVGGDGVLFDCLNGAVGLPNVELGIIPYGKGNNFYHVFGEDSKDVFTSLKAQIGAPSVPMDALYCGSNYALNHCLIGLEAFCRSNIKRIREGRTLMDKYISTFAGLLGTNCLYLASILNPDILKQSYRIWMDDENLNGTHTFINIVNSPCYSGNRKYAIHEADPSDGWLDVLISTEMNLRNFNKILNKYTKGCHAKYPNLFEYRRVKKVFLTSNNPLIFNLDGEIFYDKYISVEIKPKIIRIIDPTQMSQR